MKKWQAHALKNHPLEVQAGLLRGKLWERRCCVPDHRHTSRICKDLSRHFCADSVAFFSYRFLSILEQDVLGSTKSAFCIISDPETQKIEQKETVTC